METPVIEGRNLVFSASHTQLIIHERYGLYLHTSNQRDLVKFTQFYWDSVKGCGRYLKDVEFYDLTPDERENITCKSFTLWRNYRVETGLLV